MGALSAIVVLALALVILTLGQIKSSDAIGSTPAPKTIQWTVAQTVDWTRWRFGLQFRVC
jgi:hypothetical protein